MIRGKLQARRLFQGGIAWTAGWRIVYGMPLRFCDVVTVLALSGEEVVCSGIAVGPGAGL